MAGPEDSIVKGGREAIEEWMSHNPGRGLFAQNVTLPNHTDLSSLDLSSFRFHDCTFLSTRFDTSVLTRTDFSRSKFLEGTDLSNSIAEATNFEDCEFSADTVLPTRMTIGSFQKAKLTGCYLPRTLDRTNMRHAVLCDADLSGSVLTKVNLEAADLRGSDLRGARLERCVLTGAQLEGARINGRTRIELLHMVSDPNATEATELFDFSFPWTLLRWSQIRWLANVPLFGLSYLGLVVSLGVLTGLEWVNTHQFSEALVYPVQTPPGMKLLLISSLLLAISVTVFSLACPERVRDFSESEWVDQLGHARLRYVAEDIRRWHAQAVSGVCLVVGGATATWLLATRVSAALAYLLG